MIRLEKSIDADLNHDRSRPFALLSRCPRNRMSDSTIRIQESVEELDDLAAEESSRAKLNRLAVLKLYALFVRSGETEPVPAIARSVGVAEDTVRKWLETYRQSGISGLLSGGKRVVRAPESRKRTSQDAREQPPEDACAAVASVRLTESVEDVTRYGRDAEAEAAEEAADDESVHVDFQPDTDTERSVIVANAADRHRLLFDEIEEDDQEDSDSPVATSPLAATQRSSFKDQLRLRARAGRRAVGRATKRLLRKEDAAHALERATSTEASLLPKVHPTPASTQNPVKGGTGASEESASDTERAVPPASSTFNSEAFAKGKRIDQSAGGLNGAWVLVAETDDMIASIIRHRLEKQGAKVVVAPDGMEVVSTLWRRDFDLLVTAVALPGLDGFEITRWVRESARHTRIPVMVMSWPGNESDLVRAFDAGADDFMYKPFSPVELITRLKRLRRSAATGGGTTAASDAA